ncbi:sulfotransferase, partial [Acidobacteriota bacterium]
CSANVTAFHEPKPILQYFSNYVYHHQEETKTLEKIINAARMELILEVFIQNKIYVESNQCLTFFAPVIAGLFKKSKFVHLVRHPGDFLRSAIRKGWHKNDSIWESGRVKMKDKKQWAQMDQIERLSWLWMTTNQFIEDFKTQVHRSRVFTLKFEDLVEKKKTVKKLLKFIGGHPIAPEKIDEIQRTKINELHIHPNEPPTMKKVVDFPLYSQWDDEMKNKLKKYGKKLGLIYNYDI